MMATKEQIIKFLSTPQRIAIVGMAQDADRPSHYVPVFLEENSHEIIPIHPILTDLAGRKAYKKLQSINPRPDVVIIYMGMRSVDRFVSEAIDLQIPLIWLPLQITSGLKSKAENIGLIFVEDKCPKIEWNNLIE